MIGPLSPHLCTLKEPDRLYYKTIYCGVCQSMKNRFGRLSTLALAHDATFLGLLFPQAEAEAVQSVRCTVNPFRKIQALSEDHPLIQTCLLINTVFVFCKYFDQVADQEISHLQTFSIAGLLKKGALLLPLLDLSTEQLQEYIQEQLRQEKTPGLPWEEYLTPSTNLSAHLFGKIFAPHTEEATLVRALGRIYIQMIALYDSIKDYEEDLQKNHFNLFRILEAQKGRSDAFHTVHLLCERFLSLALEVAPPSNQALLKDAFLSGFRSKLKQAEKFLWTFLNKPANISSPF